MDVLRMLMGFVGLVLVVGIGGMVLEMIVLLFMFAFVVDPRTLRVTDDPDDSEAVVGEMITLPSGPMTILSTSDSELASMYLVSKWLFSLRSSDVFLPRTRLKKIFRIEKMSPYQKISDLNEKESYLQV
jgi:hypothetical protein